MWPDPIRGFVRPAVVARIAPSAHVHTQAIFVVINEATMDMTKKLTKALIEMYWERKCLWQVSSEEYKKRDLKKKAYQEIVTFLRRNGVTNANMKQVRDKIQNLRRAMRKEKKRIDDSGGTYSPSLWYYDLLTFVNDQYDENKSNHLIDVDDFDEDSDSNFENLKEFVGQDNLDSDPARKPSSSSNIDAANNPPAEIAKPDEYDALGINIAAKVKRMDSIQQIYAELLIQKVIARGLLGQLSETTEIMDLVPDNGAIVRIGPVMPPNVDAYRKVNNEFVNRSG